MATLSVPVFFSLFLKHNMPFFTPLPTNNAQVDMTLLINPKNVRMFGKEQNGECSVPIREGSGIENVAVAYLPSMSIIVLDFQSTNQVFEFLNSRLHQLIFWRRNHFPPYVCTKEAIHIRLHPNNINRDSGIEIPEAWIPPFRKYNSRPTTKRTCEGTTSNSRNNNEDRNAPIAANHHATNSDT